MQHIPDNCKCCGKATNHNKYYIDSFPIATVWEKVCYHCQEWIKQFGL